MAASGSGYHVFFLSKHLTLGINSVLGVYLLNISLEFTFMSRHKHGKKSLIIILSGGWNYKKRNPIIKREEYDFAVSHK